MSTFKVKLEVQGFKLEVEGERDDIPLIAENIGRQFTSALEPAANIAEGTPPRRPIANTAPATAQSPSKPRRKRNRPATASASENILNWDHNPERWGNPLQTWTTAEKSIWLLYVLEHELGRTAVAGPVLAATFNQHFKQAKTVHPPNVTRDLGKIKTGSNSDVGEDTTTSPSEWYLTSSGKKRAVKLIEQALGGTGAEEESDLHGAD
ncbi:MAG: hypothetical protein AAFX79_11870 [Planctomycetota bacterium]